MLPDEAPGEDRIPDQLMYVPPEGFVPENMEDSDVPLKTILMWNGLGSWGGLRPGRGVFIKEQCPVSSCVISSSRIDGQKADLVVFKVSCQKITKFRKMAFRFIVSGFSFKCTSRFT